MPDPIIDSLGTPIRKKYTDPLDYLPGATTPSREESQRLQETESYKGDNSSYDKNLGYGLDQEKLRARNQGILPSLANQGFKSLLGIPLDIVENIGYLGEMVGDWDLKNKDYSNFLTEIAKSGKEKLDEVAPVYRQNQDEVFDPFDSAWWIENGGGLVQSIGSFLVTGAGIGKGLGQAAKVIQQTAKAGGFGSKALEIGTNLGAQLGTSSSLAYMETAMDASQVYQDVLDQTGDINRASDAAVRTMRIGVPALTLLNLGSVAPLFKNVDKLSKTQLLEQATKKETRNKYLAVLGREGVAEGFEEDINLFARDEGKIVGGIKKQTKSDWVERLMDNIFSEEGGVSFGLGFVGGVGQRVGLGQLVKGDYTDTSTRITKKEFASLPEEEKILYKPIIGEDGKVQYTLPRKVRYKLDTLRELEEQDDAKAKLAAFQSDINNFDKLQRWMSEAVQRGDKQEIEKLQNQLFSVGAARSIRNGLGEELAKEVENIGNTDNDTLDENGQTQAMKLGLAENMQDNDYKRKAVQAANDVRQLSKDYTDLSYKTDSPIALNRLFNNRLDILASQNTINDYTTRLNSIRAKAQETTTDPDNFGVIETTAKIHAYRIANLILNKKLEEYKKRKDNEAVSNTERELKMLENSLLLDTENLKVLSQNIDEGIVARNTSIIEDMIPDLAAILVEQVNLNTQKLRYNNSLSNIKKFEKESEEKIQKELLKQVQEKVLKEEKENIRQQQINDKEIAKEEKALKEQEQKRIEQVNNIVDRLNKGEKLTTPEDIQLYQNNVQEIQSKLQLSQEEKTEPISSLEGNSSVPVGSDNTSNIETITYEERNNKEIEEDTTNIEESITKLDTTNENDYNTIAYQTQYSGDEEIYGGNATFNDKYKLNHTSALKVGMDVELRIDENNAIYNKNKDNVDLVPIGIYIKGQEQPIGYVRANYKNNIKLKELRSYIVKNGTTKTNLSNIGLGFLLKLPKGQKQSSRDTFHTEVQFAIGDGENLLISKNTPVDLPIHGGSRKNGFVHAIVSVNPARKNISIPLDINKVTPEIASSMVEALYLYLNRANLDQNQLAIVDKLDNNFNINLTTIEGLTKYVEQFIYTTKNLITNHPDLISKNDLKGDHYFLQVTNTGFSYLKSGEAIQQKSESGDVIIKPNEVGINTPIDRLPELKERLVKHISNLYMRVDRDLIKDNNPIKLALIQNKDNKLSIQDVSKPSYYDYILDNTNTNIVGQRVSEIETTYFRHPTLEFNTDFLNKDQENIKKNIEETTGERVILATKSKKGLSGLRVKKDTDIITTDPTLATEQEAKDLEKNCKI